VRHGLHEWMWHVFSAVLDYLLCFGANSTITVHHLTPYTTHTLGFPSFLLETSKINNILKVVVFCSFTTYQFLFCLYIWNSSNTSTIDFMVDLHELHYFLHWPTFMSCFQNMFWIVWFITLCLMSPVRSAYCSRIYIPLSSVYPVTFCIQQ
jgi:hypothetical protein